MPCTNISIDTDKEVMFSSEGYGKKTPNSLAPNLVEGCGMGQKDKEKKKAKCKVQGGPK